MTSQNQDVKVLWSAERSYGDVVEHSVNDDLGLLGIGYLLMLVYVALALGKRNFLELKVSTLTFV